MVFRSFMLGTWGGALAGGFTSLPKTILPGHSNRPSTENRGGPRAGRNNVQKEFDEQLELAEGEDPEGDDGG